MSSVLMTVRTSSGLERTLLSPRCRDRDRNILVLPHYLHHRTLPRNDVRPTRLFKYHVLFFRVQSIVGCIPHVLVQVYTRCLSPSNHSLIRPSDSRPDICFCSSELLSDVLVLTGRSVCGTWSVSWVFSEFKKV